MLSPLLHIPLTYLVNPSGHRDPGGRHGNTDERLVAMGRSLTGAGQQTDPVGLGAISNPHLTPVDHQVL